MRISSTLNFYAHFLSLPPLSPQLILDPTSSFNLSQHFPCPSLFPSFSPSILTSPDYWLDFSNNPSAFKRQPAIQKVWGVEWGRRAVQTCGSLNGGRVVEGCIGLWFPLNCPTWLSVLSLNKHSHFLLTAHIEYTDKRACTHTQYTQTGRTGVLKLQHTHTRAHMNIIHCIPWQAADNTLILSLQPVNPQLSPDCNSKTVTKHLKKNDSNQNLESNSKDPSYLHLRHHAVDIQGGPLPLHLWQLE